MYPHTVAARGASYNEFRPGPDPFHYRKINCTGSEETLNLCNKHSPELCNSHTQDVGVVCLSKCTFGDIRLIDGTEETNGRVEICIGGYWGTICDEEFDVLDAQIVCKQLGYPYQGAEVKYNAFFGGGTDHGIALTSLGCHGNENMIISCNYNTGSAITCNHDDDVGVICQEACNNGAIRLGNSGTMNAGRVEVCYNGQWGTICHKGWDTNDARVACYQLGFNPSSKQSQYHNNHYQYKQM